jgi:anti-sigma factor RsiW
MKRGFQAGGRRFMPPVEFRKQMHQTILVKPRRARMMLGWVMATAVTALLAVIGWTSTVRLQERIYAAHIYSEVADLHVATLASSFPVDVVSSDRHTVKPWFQGKIPFAFDLPHLQGSDFAMVGGR